MSRSLSRVYDISIQAQLKPLPIYARDNAFMCKSLRMGFKNSERQRICRQKIFRKAVSISQNGESSRIYSRPLQGESRKSLFGRGRLLGLNKLCIFLALSSLLFLGTSGSAYASTSGHQSGLGGFLTQTLDVILHLDHHLAQIIGKYGKATYAILWGIVFCETGLVITPFLPGDSLLFACGALASLGSLNLTALFGIFISAAILGDALNYQLGKIFGERAKTSRLVKKEYLEKTEKFYENYGGKTVVLARFIPIVRTFAPFVAGVGAMSYSNFSFYNVAGALLWTSLFVGGGALLGNVPAVKHNFSIVVFAIIGVSLLPVVFEVFQARRHKTELPEPGKSSTSAT